MSLSVLLLLSQKILIHDYWTETSCFVLRLLMSMERVKLPLPLLFVTGLTLDKLHISNLKHSKKKIIKHAKKIHSPLRITLSRDPGGMEIDGSLLNSSLYKKMPD